MFANHDTKTIQEIEEKLDNLRLVGLNVVRINISNILPSDETSLVDILQQNPQVVSLGIGLGVPESVIEIPRTQFIDRPPRFYHMDGIRDVTLQYYPPLTPETPLPRNLGELVVLLNIGKPTGLSLGGFLGRVVTGKCAPKLALMSVENVDSWEGFYIPEKILTVRLDKRRNIPTLLSDVLKKGGFERVSRGECEVVYTRLGVGP